MTRDLNVMATIQAEKEKEIEASEQIPLAGEGNVLASEKRFTFDVITVPTDPLR